MRSCAILKHTGGDENEEITDCDAERHAVRLQLRLLRETDARVLVQESGERADMSGYEMLEDDEHVFYQKTMEEVLALFEEGKSAIVYLGYVGCPWCEEAVPIMNEVAKAKGLTICYAPTYDDGEVYDHR